MSRRLVFGAVCAVALATFESPSAVSGLRFPTTGAYGPDYFQTDVRAGWRLRTAKNTLEFIVDVYNITNRTNFENPSADRRLTESFLVPTALRGGSGFPRQAQLGVRYTF